jgi:hypothetical protein
VAILLPGLAVPENLVSPVLAGETLSCRIAFDGTLRTSHTERK